MSEPVSMPANRTASRVPNPSLLLVAGFISALLAAIVLVALTQGGVAWPILGMAASGAVCALVTARFLAARSSAEKQTFSLFQMLKAQSRETMFLTDRSGNRLCSDSRFKDALPLLKGNKDAVIYRLLETVRQHGQGSEHVITQQDDGYTLCASQLGDDAVLWRLTHAPQFGSSNGLSSSFVHVIADEDDNVTLSNSIARDILGRQPTKLGDLVDRPTLHNGGLFQLAHNQDQIVRALVNPCADGAREVILAPVNPLESAGAELDQLLDRMPVALTRIQPDGVLSFANEPARALLGEGAKPGVNLSDLIEGLGRSIQERLEDVLRGRRHSRTEVARGVVNDREIFLQVTLTRVEMNGEPALLVLLSDATELKTLEAQFVQSQKMQAVGQLAGGVAHDFNNLLTAITGHCDLLMLRHDSNDIGYSDLVQIQENANRAASLVRQLLAFSRKQNLQPRVLILKETLSDLAHLLNRLLGEKVQLEITHGRDLHPVRVDKRQFEQVIMNLVVNARDAIIEQGTVQIRTSMKRFEEDMSRDRAVVPMGDYVQVEVIDSGAGIPDDKIAQIFEPFFTTKATGEGTGLGLSTAYGIIKQTGGFIFADSPPGDGARFTIYLPAYDGNEATLMAPPEKPARMVEKDHTGSGVVLLVEDEAPVRSFAARALSLRGYTVLEADCAEDALNQLSDTSLHVDVFVSDVIMPGQDGPTWVREALKTRPNVGVIFVSGYAEDAFKDGQPEIKGSMFLPKPFSLTELTERVKEQINLAKSA